MCGNPITAIGKAVGGAVSAVGGAVVDAGKAVVSTAEDVGKAVGSAASDVGDFVKDNSGAIVGVVKTAATVVASVYAGPAGGAAVGGLFGGAESVAKGNDVGDVLRDTGVGALNGASAAPGANPVLKGAAGFVSDVDAKMDKGMDLGDAFSSTAKEQDLDTLSSAATGGGVTGAAQKLGIEALKGGDAGEVLGAGLRGAVGGEGTMAAVGGGLGGLVEAGVNGTDALEGMGKGAWTGIKETNAGIDMVSGFVEDMADGKRIDQALIDQGEKLLETGLQQIGVDKQWADGISDAGHAFVTDVNNGESVWHAASNAGGEMLGTGLEKLGVDEAAAERVGSEAGHIGADIADGKSIEDIGSNVLDRQKDAIVDFAGDNASALAKEAGMTDEQAAYFKDGIDLAGDIAGGKDAGKALLDYGAGKAEEVARENGVSQETIDIAKDGAGAAWDIAEGKDPIATLANFGKEQLSATEFGSDALGYIEQAEDACHQLGNLENLGGEMLDKAHEEIGSYLPEMPALEPAVENVADDLLPGGAAFADVAQQIWQTA